MSDNVVEPKPTFIERLTPEQEANLVHVRDKWVVIGKSTSRCDRPRAEKLIAEAYKTTGFDAPDLILWARSPREGCILSYMLEHDMLGDGRLPYDEYIKKADEFLASPDFEKNKSEVFQYTYHCGFGNHDAAWLSFYDSFTGILDSVEQLRCLMELAKDCGWYWAYKGICILSEKPIYMKTDDEGRLHHEARMAIEYEDGFGLYMWHGVMVPSFYITNPESITKDMIFAEDNQEFRRIMLEIMTFAKFLQEVEAITIDVDLARGRLVETKALAHLTGEDPVARFVCVVDPSTGREYALRVPPTVQTAQAAVAMTFDVDAAAYNPIAEA
jgi:hypothetical protein